ncbi:MAG: hypothetical protein ACI867_000600 [Glaciecola sp.]
MAPQPDDMNDRPAAVVLVRSAPSPIAELIVMAVESPGFWIPGGAVGRGLDVVEQVADLGPVLVVLDLVQAGVFGTRLVSIVRTLAPRTVIQVIVPFAGLGAVASAEGADAAHMETDLRGLRLAVKSLADSLQNEGG